MAVDPICHMQVDESTDLIVEQDGETFYFCSEHCRKKFLEQQGRQAAPEKSKDCCHHAASTIKSPESSAAYICPMCPGVESDQPGDCPKCGMALEPTRPVQPKQSVIFTCPMHPEIKQDSPGPCPICGMAVREPEGLRSYGTRTVTHRFPQERCLGGLENPPRAGDFQIF